MDNQKASFGDSAESGQPFNAHVEPTSPSNVDPYRQPHLEQAAVPLYQHPDDYKAPAESFSHPRHAGEKLIPTERFSIIGTCIKFIPPALIIFLLIFLFAGGGNLFKGMVQAKLPAIQHLQVSQPVRVIIHNQQGKVHIHNGSEGAVTISTNKTTPDWILGTVAGPNVDARVVDRGHTVLIDARRQKDTAPDDQDTDLDVTVPPSVDIQASVQHGSAYIEGVSGNMDVEVSDSINAQNVNSGSGRIIFKAHDGAIDVDQIQGQTFFSTYQGHIELVNAYLSRFSRLSTQDGKIAFDGNVEAGSKYSFETRTGNIEVALPSTASFALHIRAENGSIDNAFDSDVVGPAPRAQIGIATLSGNVEINENN
ncbi:hypothetical protein KDA_13690 [Dictyobacter alpinus]|uniref:Adhesin domain-containing protein n=1 Tax=Dictyobacter alpinus TaxID=2014873 RepID=A0A402B3G2_9CHLR|nr:DUF4097 family beta strand repeat-containing protein [Dictyobacter alpinus]GCE25885.1 hypothetical protein KDA_13690 [Dictyobacter alpinus]